MSNIRNGINPESNFKWVLPVLLLVPALIYLPGILNGIPYPADNAPYTDLMITHYPYLLYLKNFLIEYRALPLWSSLIYSGMPFAANPLSGLFYFPGWIAMLFPLPAGISIVVALHIIFGTTGFYLLLKKEGLGEIAALLGAFAFGLMPKLSAHYGAGHITLIYAISWTPWLFYIRKVDGAGWYSGLFAAMLFLADPRWSVYAGSIWVVYIFAHRHYRDWKRELIYLGKASFSAVLVASPLVLPLVEFSRLSTRADLALSDMLDSYLPFTKLLGIIIPTHGGNIEWYMYPGGLVLVLFILLIVERKLRHKYIFWIVTAFICIILSLGVGLSSASWLTQIPIVSLLRVPPRALFVLGFSLSFLAGVAIDSLLKREISDRIINKTAFGLLLFSLATAAGLAVYVRENITTLIWGLVFMAFGSLILILSTKQINSNYLVLLLGLFLLSDLLLVGIDNYSVKPNERAEDWQDLEKFFNNQDDYFRTYSPSYSIPQDVAVQLGLELADGVDPLQLRDYVEFMEIATQIQVDGYSVSIPPFRSGNPDLDNSKSNPVASKLALVGVKYVVSHFEIMDMNLEYAGFMSDRYVYQNGAFLGRAWIEPPGTNGSTSLKMPAVPGEVNIISLQPNRIVLRGEGPGTLILSEIYYPGWSATVDEEPAQIERAYGILRSVSLPEGEHTVTFVFNPLSVYIGILMAASCWIFVLLSIVRKIL